MNLKEYIESTLSEAELYKSQGLLNESKKKYITIRKLLNKNDRIKNKNKILNSLNRKIESLERQIDNFNRTQSMPTLSPKTQNLIKKIFVDKQKDKDGRQLQGAIALAKFGQFNRAIAELNKILFIESVQVEAAKNIIRCYLELSLEDKAIDNFKNWASNKIFSESKFKIIKQFFQHLLDKKNIKTDLDIIIPKNNLVHAIDGKDDEDEILDIESIIITLHNGSKEEKKIDLDVSFQEGNVINLLISSQDKEILNNLNVGVKLNNIDLYSSIAIFKGQGVVITKKQINSGPKQGYYSFDVKIKGQV